MEDVEIIKHADASSVSAHQYAEYGVKTQSFIHAAACRCGRTWFCFCADKNDHSLNYCNECRGVVVGTPEEPWLQKVVKRLVRIFQG